MGHSNLRASLTNRYSALTGQLREVHENIARIRREAEKLPQLEQSIPKLEALVEAAAMLLSDADPTWKRDETPAIKPWTHTLSVPFGTCGRRGMEVLRLADRAMTCREIAIEVLRQSGAEAPDRQLTQKTNNAIEASFRKHRGRTVESSGKYPAQWRTIAKQGLRFDT